MATSDGSPGRIGSVLFLLSLLLVGGAFLFNSVRALETVEFHVDETYWLSEAIYFRLFFQELDFANVAWSDYWGIRNPPLVKYIYGAALGLSGHLMADARLRDVYGAFWNDPEALLANTPPASLRIGRVTAWLFGLLSGLFVFLIASEIGGRWLGVVAVGLLAADRLLLVGFSRSMSESIVIFLTCLFVFVCLRFFVTDRSLLEGRADRWLTLAVAACIALLALAKPSGPVTGIVFALVAAGFYAGRAALRGARNQTLQVRNHEPPLTLRWLGVVSLVGLLAYAVMVVFNPYLHRQTLPGMAASVRAWQEHIQAQQDRMPAEALTSIGEKVWYLGERGFPLQIGQNAVLKAANLAVLLLGSLVLVVKGLRRTRAEANPSSELVFLLSVLLLMVAHAVWIPLAWPRYALIAHPFTILIQSAGLVFLMGLVARWFRDRDSRPV